MPRNIPPLRVVELFAGVGGFREALDRRFSAEAPPGFDFVWSNQWEPAEAARAPEQQSANRVYIAKFGGHGAHYPDDIHKLTLAEGELREVPTDFDLLVGGFPCQDYSVAKPKNASKGIRGPKGVLWWSIERILRERTPSYALLENVDRLLGSPASNRGRDFAVILEGLLTEGYVVEWRIINASDYGCPQRRRRVFILAQREESRAVAKRGLASATPEEVILSEGVLARAFPCVRAAGPTSTFDFRQFAADDDLGRRYSHGDAPSPFLHAGFARGNQAYSMRVEPRPVRAARSLGDVVRAVTPPPNAASFRLKDEQVAAWAYAKGPKNEPRRKASVLKEYVSSRLSAGRSKADAEAVREVMAALPGKLGMDELLTVSVRGRTAEVRIAREELNQRIVGEFGFPMGRKGRPAVLARSQIDSLPRGDAWRSVVEGMLELAAERAATQLGMRTREAREELAHELRGDLVAAIEALLKPRTATLRGKEFDRDEVASHSFAYGYKEGGMSFPDPLDGAGRTIITSEGGAAVSRFKHVVCEGCAAGKRHRHPVDCLQEGKLRRLYPEELERMNGFGERHSRVCEELRVADGKRAFFMGNALVVDLVRDIGRELAEAHGA